MALVPCTPVIGIDMWEHAYFHKYQGDKAAYVGNFWNYVDWTKVSANFEKFNEQHKVAPVLQ